MRFSRATPVAATSMACTKRYRGPTIAPKNPNYGLHGKIIIKRVNIGSECERSDHAPSASTAAVPWARLCVPKRRLYNEQ